MFLHYQTLAQGAGNFYTTGRGLSRWPPEMDGNPRSNLYKDIEKNSKSKKQHIAKKQTKNNDEKTQKIDPKKCPKNIEKMTSKNDRF